MSSRVTRRQLLRHAGAASFVAGISGPLLLTPGKAKATDHIVLISWGGNYREAVETTLCKPFSKETGIDVTVSDTPDLAKVKVQVTGGQVEWDVFDAPGSMMMSGSRQGFWEALDPSIIDTADIQVGTNRDNVAFYLAAGGIGFDPKRTPEGKHPEDFTQFWDINGFPGRRGLRTRISEMLEMALVADGVAPRQLYPLDVERGFQSLDRIKPHIQKWIDESPQALTLVQTNEIDFSYVYSGRIKAARAQGASLDYSFKQNINIPEYLSVLKGAPHKEAAMKFVAFALRPDRNAAFAEALSYIPANRKSAALMSEASRKWLPDLASPNNVTMNDVWWAEKFDALQRRFKEWLIT
jgi:putative spermidine/putrescine transport system substrate-binding protein